MQKIKLVEATSPLSKMRWSTFASALNNSGMEWDWDSEWYGDGMLSLSKDGKTLDLTIEWEEGDDYNKYDIPRTLCDVSFTPYEDSVPESALDGVNQAKNIPALVRELEALVDRSASESRHPGTRNRPHAREAFSPKTVTIGTQTWMAENLDVDDGGEGIYFNEENGEHYYTWEAAVRVSKSIPGWHLPPDVVWATAALACGAREDPRFPGDYAGAAKLKSKLNIKLAGHWRLDSFYSVGRFARFWTSSENGFSFAYNRYFSAGASLGSSFSDKATFAYSVRLVKD